MPKRRERSRHDKCSISMTGIVAALAIVIGWIVSHGCSHTPMGQHFGSQGREDIWIG